MVTRTATIDLQAIMKIASAFEDAPALVPFKLRIRERLRQRIEDSAKAHGHSMNSEITRILETPLIMEKPALVKKARKGS